MESLGSSGNQTISQAISLSISLHNMSGSASNKSDSFQGNFFNITSIETSHSFH